MSRRSRSISFTRRQALAGYGALLASSPLSGQRLIGEPAGRIAPVQELVNAFEFEEMALRRLPSTIFMEISGSDRKAFDRITFRPRQMVNTSKLDLTTELFGQSMLAPIVVGPISQQNRFHTEGELAMARGAAAAKAVMVIADRSSQPLDQIAPLAKAGFWYQVYPEPNIDALRDRVKRAIDLGCKAVCLTLGVSNPPWDWSAIDRFRERLGTPLLLKGIMSPDEAQSAVSKGVQGIVASNYAGPSAHGLASPMDTLPIIVEAAAGKAPVLIDGSFRRGSDVLKAIALGARAVLVGRPAVWGLAAYGAEGVQNIIELMQTEMARAMAMCGRPNIKAIDRTMVKIHRW